MKLFENRVGRPSNKTIKRRKIFYAVITVMVLAIILSTVYMLNSALNTKKIKGLSRPKVVNTPTFEIVGVDTALKIGDKSYKMGEYVETNQINNDIQNDLILVPSGKKIGLNGRFPKTFYNKIFKNKFVYKVGAYDKNDNLIGNINSIKIDKQDNQFNFVINQNVSYIKATVTVDILGYESNPILEDKIYVSTISETKKINIEYKDIDGIKANDKGIFETPTYGAKSSYAVISNPNNQTLYYRWYTYPSFNTNVNPSYNSMRDDYCVASSDSTIIVKYALGLSVTKSSPERSGLVRVYLNKEQCMKDRNAKDASAVKEKFVKYKYNASSKNEITKYTLTPVSNDATKGGSVLQKGKSINIDNRFSGTVYVNNSGTDIIRLSIKFPKNIYTLSGNDARYMRFLALDKSGKSIDNQSSNVEKISNQDYSKEFVINNNVKTIRITTYIKNSISNAYYPMYQISIKVDLEKVSISFSDKYSKDTSGTYLVSKAGDYIPTANISNIEGKTLYYRWFTYVGLNANKYNYTDPCVKITKKDTKITNLECLTVNSSGDRARRSGKLKVYSTQKACNADTKGSRATDVLSAKIVNYKYSKNVTTTKKTTSGNNISIVLKDRSGLKSSNNIVNVNKTGNYHVEATVTQTNKTRLYYRWDTYKGVNANTHSYTDTLSHGNYAYCSSFTDKSKTFTSLETLEFTNKNTPRSGKFSLYNSESDCRNNKNVVKSAVIGYQIGSQTTTTKSGSNGVTIKLEDKDGKSTDSSNVVRVSNTGTYYVKATVTQTGGKTLYYRWDTFNGLNNNTWRYSNVNNRCIEFNSNSKVVDNLESLEFYDKNTPRSGRFSVYTNKNTCVNDSYNSGKGSVATATIAYAYSALSTNKTNLKTVSYNYDEIGNKFGAQASSACYSAALTYGAWIALGYNRKDIMNVTPGPGYSSWKAIGGEGNNTLDVYKTIIKHIDKGSPVVVHGNCESDGYWEHWVTVVGYTEGKKIEKMKASDFLVLDPNGYREISLAEALPGGLGWSGVYDYAYWK